MAAAVAEAGRLASASCDALPDPGDAPELLGAVYEATLVRERRRRAGSYFTPAPVARGLVRHALAGGPRPDEVVLDPACGAGVFLLAAVRALRSPGEPGAARPTAAACVAAVRGCDTDPAAVAVARLALAWWAWSDGGTVAWADPSDLRVGDGLAAAHDGGPAPAAATLVIGNPPFLTQLRQRTARSDRQRRALQQRFGVAAGGYVDTATLFLLAGLDAVVDGGRVVLVQPESMVVAAHGQAARAQLASRAELEALWVGGADVFAAGVRVCAPVLRRTAQPAPRSVQLLRGRHVEPDGRFDVDSPDRGAALTAGTWAPILAAARGVPRSALGGAGRRTLADLATATAGFRDQFYGLAPYVIELAAPRPGDGAVGRTGAVPPGFAPLVTSGSITVEGPGRGDRPRRFNGVRYQRPAVDLQRLQVGDAALHAWVTARLRPKVLVAAQAPVLRMAVDPRGELVPSVPVITVEPLDEDDLWLVAAVLGAPVVSLEVAHRCAGAGLSAAALRVSARQLLDLPVPDDDSAWRKAAGTLRRAVERATDAEPNAVGVVPSLQGLLGPVMATAYGVPREAAEQAQRWWEGRCGRHRPATFL